MMLGEEARGHAGDPPPDQVLIGQIVVASSAGLSMIGALIIVISFFATSWGSWRVDINTAGVEDKIKALAQGYLLQLVCLSISNFFSGLFYALALAIPRDLANVDTTCKVQAVGRSYFPLASAFWNLILSVELHRFMNARDKDLSGRFARNRYLWYHVLGWIPAGCVVAVLYNVKGIENEGLWCWTNSPGSYHAIAQFAVWIIVACLNIHIGILVRRQVHQSTQGFRKLILSLLLYPLTFVVIWVAMLVHEFGVGFVKDGTIYGSPTIRYITAITAPSQGFLNCIVFICTNSKARKYLCSCEMNSSLRDNSSEHTTFLLGSNGEASVNQNTVTSESIKPEGDVRDEDIDDYYYYNRKKSLSMQDDDEVIF